MLIVLRHIGCLQIISVAQCTGMCGICVFCFFQILHAVAEFRKKSYPFHSRCKYIEHLPFCVSQNKSDIML